MAEQHLDGAEVSSDFKQVRREAVSQGMWMDVLVLQAGADGGLPAGLSTAPWS